MFGHRFIIQGTKPMAEYTVKLDIAYTATVTVDAASEQEAAEKAMDLARRDQADKDFLETSAVSIEVEPDEVSDHAYFAAGNDA